MTSISGWAQSTYYISPTGSDEALGTAPNSAWQTLNKLNEQVFAPGDQILFERGGHWLGMFHVKGSGSPTQPIVLSDFGSQDQPAPSLDGDGFQSALLIYNDSFITVENLVFTNQASHLDSNGVVKKLPTFLGESNDWGSGKNVRFGIKVVADATPIEGIVVRDVVIHDIFPTPTNLENKHLGYASSWKTDQIHFWAMSTPSIMLSSRTRKSHGLVIMAFGLKHLGWLGTTTSKTPTFTSKDAPFHTPGDQVLSPTDVGTLW